MNEQKLELYFLLMGIDRETHDTTCCCGMPTELPHEAYGARIYQLDVQGLQALYAFYQRWDDVSFDEWLAEQESEGTYYGASEEAARDEALLQAQKQGILVVNYPQTLGHQRIIQQLSAPHLPVFRFKTASAGEYGIPHRCGHKETVFIAGSVEMELLQLSLQNCPVCKQMVEQHQLEEVLKNAPSGQIQCVTDQNGRLVTVIRIDQHRCRVLLSYTGEEPFEQFEVEIPQVTTELYQRNFHDLYWSERPFTSKDIV